MNKLFSATRAFLGVLVCALSLQASAAFADPAFPALTGRVVDDAGVLSADAQTRLASMSKALEDKTHDQLVVVTLKSLQGYEIEQYGYQLGRHWGIGQKGTNNGALLIIAPKEHKVRIEVGYGLEGVLTDAQSKLIIENIMLPAFRKGDYDGGTLAGTATILSVFGVNTKDVDQYLPQDTAQQSDQGGKFPLVIGVFICWLVFGRFLWPLLFLGALGGRRGGWGGGGFGGGGFGGGGFGGGGFGGGGFSGGGGSFGGGGASGSW
jgi:uncharacterized protein